MQRIEENLFASRPERGYSFSIRMRAAARGHLTFSRSGVFNMTLVRRHPRWFGVFSCSLLGLTVLIWMALRPAAPAVAAAAAVWPPTYVPLDAAAVGEVGR